MTAPAAATRGATWSSTRRAAAIVTPLDCGQAHFAWRGIEHTFADVATALAECRRIGIHAEVQPFRPTPVEVTWTRPALQSVTS